MDAMIDWKKGSAKVCTLAVLLCCVWQAARAEVTVDVTQTLDSVDAITARSVLEMHVDANPPDECAPDDYACVTTSLPTSGTLLPGIPAGATFAACQRASDRRMYCVLNSFGSGAALRQPVSRWTDAGTYEALFDCSDPAFGFDQAQANPCGTITTTLGGDVWLSGRTGTTYSIVKVVEVKQGAACPAGFGGAAMTRLTAESNPAYDYCMLRYASGRPAASDATSIDAKVGSRLEAPGVSAGPGLLLVEDRRTVTFLPDRTDSQGRPVQLAPVAIATGATDWNLGTNEWLQSTTLLQVNCTVNACDNYLLAATTTGRVMAKRIDLPGVPSGLVLGPALNVVSNPVCTPALLAQQSWVRVSPQSGRIYLSDRCGNAVRGYAVPLDTYTTSSAWTQVVSLSTRNPDGSANAPNTLSVSPGIPIDLAQCLTARCILYPDGPDTANDVGAYITHVHIELLTGRSGMSVFRIRGIPDCRFANPLPPVCLGPNPNSPDPNYAIETIGGEKYLRVDKLLPVEVLALFDANTQPTLANLQLRIGPQFRARPEPTGRNNTFDAFFGRTEDGVMFRETFDLEFDIRELMGDASGTPTRCGYLNDGLNGNTRSPDNWDVIATTSERTKVAGTNNGTGAKPGGTLLNRDLLVNTSCENPTAGSGTRWSLYAYGLMQSACVTNNVVTSTSYACRSSFVDLASRLFDDLERARVLTACANVDGNPATGGADSGWPLKAATCSALAGDWSASRSKLNGCLDATTQPKNSALNQNCQAFVTQFLKYQQDLDAAVVNGAVVNGLQTGDVANRLGELRSRVKVFLHVYNDQMLPSVPPGGIPK
jgi:hypothetical protein